MRKCAILLIIATIVNMLAGFGVYATEQTTVEVDNRYEKSINLLSDLGIFPTDKKKDPDSTITRSDFATVLVYLMGKKKYVGGESANKYEYLDYNNDPIIDEWTWFDPNVVIETESIATPFYDVTKEHQNWENIEIVAKSGIMTGDTNNNFSPDRKITLAEVSKVLIALNGVKDEKPFEYPNGYYSKAMQLGILDGIKTKDKSDYITYRDLIVTLDNFIHIDVYGVYLKSPSIYINEPAYVLCEDEPYMNVLFDIYKTKGVVTENENTALKGKPSVYKNEIKLNDIIFTGNESSKDYLGYNVDVYYIPAEESKEDVNELLHIRKNDKNTVTVIEANDIIGYNDTTFSYYEGKKSKSVYIGIKTPIIYNGKLLTEYTDADITPSIGTVTIVDNGKTENVVFIDSYKTYVVSSIDHDTGKIIDKLTGASITVDDEALIRHKDGREMMITDINKGSVISIMESKATDGKLVEIIISNDVVSGIITSIKDEDDYIVLINGTEYTFLDDVDKSGIIIGDEVEMYLDIFGKVARYESKTKKLSYGYLIKGNTYEDDETAKTVAQFTLYTIDNEKIEKIRVGDKLRINNKPYKAEKITGCQELYAGGFVKQLIKYGLDENGYISEIYTANADKNQFVSIVDRLETGAHVSWRNVSIDSKMYEKLPVCSFDGKTKFLRVPSDVQYEDNEDYYYIKAYEDGVGYKDFKYAAYADTDQTFKATVVLCMETSAASLNAGSRAAQMIKEKSKILNDEGEVTTKLVIVGDTGEKTYYLPESADIATGDTIEDLSKGDLVKFKYKTANNEITFIDKVFDAGNTNLTIDDTEPDMIAPFNPVVDISGTEGVNGTATAYLQNYSLLHAQVKGIWGDEGTVKLAPYVYTAYGVQQTSEATETDTAKWYNLNLSNPRVFVFDSEGNRVEDGTKKDVVEGREIVYYAFWTTGKTIFVYK